MERKILSVFLSVMIGIVPINVFAASERLTLNEKKQMEFENDEYKMFVFYIVEDGMYEFEYESDYHYSGIALFNESGDTDLKYHRSPKYNVIEDIYSGKTEIYLHKGNYNARVRGSGKTSVIYKKMNNDYAPDREPNDDINNLITLLTNKYYSGYVDGALPSGEFDESDMYVFQAQKDVKYKISVESSGNITFRFLKINDTGESGWLFEKEAKKNEIENIYKLNDEISFPETGTYYIEAVGRNRYSSYSYPNEIGYKFILSNGENSNISNALPETITTPVGIKINWDNTANTGYRVYRAEPGGIPTAISGVIYGNSFVDVNVESNKKYYYMAVPESESSISAIDESISAEAVTEAIVQPENAENKNYILMKIGSPNMVMGETTLEIDPGRGTVPIVQNGRTLVPIRAIIESMGGNAEWNANEQKITLAANGHEVQMYLGKKDIIADGKTKQMDIAPEIINDRTMLPIRFAAENVGCQIEWIASSQEIIIVF